MNGSFSFIISYSVISVVLVFVEKDGSIRMRESRPLFTVTSTSFTPDEDLDMLLSSLEELDASISNFLDDSYSPTFDSNPHLVNRLCLVVFVTGRGPLRDRFVHYVQQSQYQHIHVIPLWLAPADYPRLLCMI